MTIQINRNTISGSTDIFINVHLTNTMDNMGMFTDIPFISVPVFQVLELKDKFLRPDNASLSSWFTQDSVQLSGTTDSRVIELQSYDPNNLYIVNLDIEAVTYLDYKNNVVIGVSRVTSLTSGTTEYTFDANLDPNIGTDLQTTGLRYKDSEEITVFKFYNQGNNATNSELNAIFKEDYLIGITDKLETKSDIFIDRGSVSAMERILKMSEVNSLDQLVSFGNGFFNIKNG